MKSMKPGSVIVDLAAESGGNCRLSEANKVIKAHGVTIIGYTNLPSRMAAQSSQLFGTNIYHLLTELCPNKDGVIDINMEDEVIRGATVVKEGNITWPPPAPRLSAAPKTDVSEPIKTHKDIEKEAKQPSAFGFLVPVLLHRRGATRYWLCGSCRVYGSLDRIRTVLFCGLHGGLGRQPLSAYTFDVGDECDFQHHHHRCPHPDFE